MCGITFVWQRGAEVPDARLAAEIHAKLSARGPDHLDSKQVSLGGGDAMYMKFYASVLHLRGDAVVGQPIEDRHGNILCWNGEIFSGLCLDQSDTAVSDTKRLSEELEQAQNKTEQSSEQVAFAIVQVLQQMQGPFALVYYHKAANRVYFGHDRFGRRSLLFHSGSVNDTQFQTEEPLHQKWRFQSESALFLLSSVAYGQVSNEFEEVPCVGLYAIDLPVEVDESKRELELDVHLFLWPPLAPLTDASFFMDLFDCGITTLQTSGDATAQDTNLVVSESMQQTADKLLVILSNSVGRRVRTIPKISSGNETARVGVLFSGGLDSVVLAALTHFHAPAEEPIDLLNVCFDESHLYQSPDRLAAQIAFQELQQLFPSRNWRFIAVNVPSNEMLVHQPAIKELLIPCDTQMDLNIATAFWFLARGHGQIRVYDASRNPINVDLNGFLQQSNAVKTVLEQELAPMQLWARVEQVVASATRWCPVVNCKRKVKAKCAFGVCRACCFRIQQLVTVLRGSEDAVVEKATRDQLIQIGFTSDVVDKLTCFARRAQHVNQESPMCRVHRSTLQGIGATEAMVEDQGQRNTEADSGSSIHFSSTKSVSTCARVLLVGIGADEQLGGYGRHKTAFLRGGLPALKEELEKDMTRIWKRNLGRDDRMISSHGREARFPFLDEQVVSFLTATCDLQDICDLSQPRGQGDKLVLRLVAHRLGLSHCSKLAKRAIQFGTRIAKVSNGQRCTSNRQAKGSAKLE